MGEIIHISIFLYYVYCISGEFYPFFPTTSVITLYYTNTWLKRASINQPHQQRRYQYSHQVSHFLQRQSQYHLLYIWL